MPTVEEVVYAFKRTNPPDVYEARMLTNFSYKYLGEGAFRSAYRIQGTDLVVKFPMNVYDSVDHSRTEIQAVKKLNRRKKYRALRPLLPKFYYMNEDNGVVIMEYCKPIRGKFKGIQDLIGNMVAAFLGMSSKWGTDMHEDNIGYRVKEDSWGDKTYSFKILDLGLLCDIE